MASHVPAHGVALGLLGIGLVGWLVFRRSSIPSDDMVSPGWIERRQTRAGVYVYSYPDGHQERVTGDIVEHTIPAS